MKKEKRSIQFPASLDRFEGDMGVLYLGGSADYKIDLPKAYLPAGLKEGASLQITIEEDEAAAKELGSRIRNLRQELLDRDK